MFYLMLPPATPQKLCFLVISCDIKSCLASSVAFFSSASSFLLLLLLLMDLKVLMIFKWINIHFLFFSPPLCSPLPL